MAGYILFIREDPVRDQEAMAKYLEIATGARAKSQASGNVAGQPLIVYGAMRALEGKKPDGVILMKFETIEDARRWYERDAYQEAIPHRQRAADYRVIMIEGVG